MDKQLLANPQAEFVLYAGRKTRKIGEETRRIRRNGRDLVLLRTSAATSRPRLESADTGSYQTGVSLTSQPFPYVFSLLC